jgi:exodeoxyribonuclease V alpha subunit
VIAKPIHQSPGFAIFKLKTRSDEITILGNLAGIREGEKLYVKGLWQEHPKFGRQLKVDAWEKITPTNKENAVEILSSGIIKGVGAATARRIVDTLGPDAIEIILENPEAIKKVKGLGKKAPVIAQSIQDTYDAQRIVKELVSFGMTANLARKVYQKFHRQAVELVKANPYCLTKIDQVGFSKADEIAQNIEILREKSLPGILSRKRNSKFRIQSGIHYILSVALWSEGHTYLPISELVSRVEALLNKDHNHVTKEQIIMSLESKDIAVHGKGVSLTQALKYERKLAENIKRLSGRLSNIDPAPVITWYEKTEKIKLTKEQKKAVWMAINNGLSIFTGGPGVGKTATEKAVISVFKKVFLDSRIIVIRRDTVYSPDIAVGTIWDSDGIELAAPTGRAARRMTEATGRHASTMHKLLGIRRDGKPLHDNLNPINAALVIIDEFSMADVILSRSILSAIKKGTRVLIVGDSDQLSSIGPGAVLRDMLSSNIPRVTLTQVFRQAAESQIVVNAHRINKGLPFIINSSKDDFRFVAEEDPAQAARIIVNLIKNLKYNSSELQVLTPTKKGPIGTEELNTLIQKEFNQGAKELKIYNSLFKVGDKVIQTKNNYEKQVFNGDIGIVRQLAGNGVTVDFGGVLIEYINKELKELDLAHAITIHKAQGSEFKVVIVPILAVNPIITRNLIYTAVTRAREKIILIGSITATTIAIKNNKSMQRNTLLTDYLKPA